MKDRKIILIIICLIIFVILLYFLIRHFGLINAKIPTGNVNIFDINFIEQGKDNTTNESNSLEDLNNDDYKQNYSQNDGSQINETSDNLTVYDKNTVYTSSTPLEIFKNKSYYVKNDLIAPGSENSYQFVIRNNNDFAIEYSLRFEQDNPYNINMKYRLKQDGKYIVGDDKNWVTASELLQKEMVLANYSYNVYTLDWKWFESDNETDTKIGSNIEANYSLNINIFANRY